MTVEALDHVVIHVDDWEATHAFYVGLLGMERVENPEAAGNPLDSCSYRLGSQQINVHGPWPGKEGGCCPPPLDEVGRADLAFRIALTPRATIELLRANRIEIVAGPMSRFGGLGWGTSVYCNDPSGNGVELISYEDG